MLGVSGGYVTAELSNDKGLQNVIAGAVDGAQIQGVRKYNGTANVQYNFTLFGDESVCMMGGMQWVASSGWSRARVCSIRVRLMMNDRYITRRTSVLACRSTVITWASSLRMRSMPIPYIEYPQVASIVEGYRVAPRSITMSVVENFQQPLHVVPS
jgi:iron complex outermembrane receptor protein